MFNKFWRNFDTYLFVSAVFLNILGLVAILSHTHTVDSSNIIISQAAFSVIGIICALVLSRIEYRSLSSFAPILFFLSLLLLVLVLFFGVVRNNTRAWFDFGLFSFQPSELIKVSFVLYLAHLFSKTTVHTFRQIIISIGVLLAPLLLIVLQPDLGTAITYICIWLTVILSLNLRFRQLILIIISAITTATVILGLVLLLFPKDNFQYQRLIIYPDHLFLNELNHQEIGYQVDQSLIAIGNGGVTGQGLNNGSQTRLGFVPENNTDFIFSSIAEEAGIIASLIIVFLFSLILYRTLKIARNAQDKFGRYIAAGAFGFFFYHFIQNIGMNIGILPVTGIPLSFISYGGSHIITAYLFIGLLESVILRYKKIKY